MSTPTLLRHLVAGQLKQSFIITPNGEAFSNILGGSLVYAAIGLALWENEGTGLVGRVGEDFPRQWISELERINFDVRGIRVLAEALDLRQFLAYTDPAAPQSDNPVSKYAQLGLAFPKALLGYTSPVREMDSRTRPSKLALKIKDIPDDYLDASAAHICPLDFHSHQMLTSLFMQNRVTTLTLDPGENYMHPLFWDDLSVMLKGITAFQTSEEKLHALFQGRSTDLWEMAEEIARFGCEIIVIKRKARGQLVYNHANHERWSIPAYPSRVIDPTGAGDAFGGGFLAGFRKSYHPVEAALYGNISASMVIEGSDPLYALDALPGLAEARLESLRSMARRI
jgi:sugar/nucleoside kinase (ribokinase family)